MSAPYNVTHLATPYFDCCEDHDMDPITLQLPVRAVCQTSQTWERGAKLSTSWAEVTCPECAKEVAMTLDKFGWFD